MTGANEKLGLPFGKMQKVIVAFDVDGTLITNGNYPEDGHDVPNNRIIRLLQILSTFKNIRIVVWSGGGRDYAQRWVRRLELEEYVWRVASKTEHPDIKQYGIVVAIDDIQDTAIGDVNLIVKEK